LELFSHLLVSNFLLDFIMNSECVWSRLFKIVEVCFVPGIWSILVYFCWHLKRMSVLLLLGGAVYKLFRTRWLMVDGWGSSISLLISCLVVLQIVERGLLKAPNIIADLRIPLISCISFCVMYFEALFFYANTFRVAMSSW
jgi:hypothetical protein